jgi:hypothetical protein
LSRREDFDNATWGEPVFFRLTPEAKLVYIWAKTNPRCDWSGIYQCPLPMIAMETGYTVDVVDGVLGELHEAVRVSYDGSWLWVRLRVSEINTRTVQMCKSVAKDLAKVPPDHPFRIALLAAEGRHVWQSKADRSCLLDELFGGTPNPSGSHPDTRGSDTSKPVVERNNGSDPSATPVDLRTGKGTGKGTLGGKSARRGTPQPRAFAGFSAGAIAMQAEHFPDYEISAVESAAMTLRLRHCEPTADAIRVLLEPAEIQMGEHGSGLRSVS